MKSSFNPQEEILELSSRIFSLQEKLEMHESLISELLKRLDLLEKQQDKRRPDMTEISSEMTGTSRDNGRIGSATKSVSQIAGFIDQYGKGSAT